MQIDLKRVAIDAAQFAGELRLEMLSKLVGRPLAKGETVFPVKEASLEKILAWHRALVAVTVQFRQLAGNAGLSVEAVFANEDEGVAMGDQTNYEDYLVQMPQDDERES